jgi:hypothetical protein
MVMPLRLLLPCLAVCLVAAGAAGIGIAGVSAAGDHVTRQADGVLRGCAESVLGHGLVAVPGSGQAAGGAMPGACGFQLRDAAGQMLVTAAPAVLGPAFPGGGAWPAAHLARPVTMTGAGGGHWRAVVTAVRYQPQHMMYVYGPDNLRYVISGPAGPGSSGMLIVTTPLAGTGQAAAGYAAAAGTVLVLLAAVAFILTRAILRPLREAAELAGKAGQAGQGASGRLEEAMACLSLLASRDHGQRGMTLARMHGRLQASRAAEAAARGSAADMSGQLGQACLQLRRPVSVLHGFAEYCRGQDGPPPAGLDQMLERVTDEITRMETLAAALRMCSADEPAGPDRQLDPSAAGRSDRRRSY